MIDDKILSLIEYRKNKALETVSEITILLKDNLLSLAINRIYYGCFYIVNALALIDNFSTSKHRQLIGYFNKNYIYSGILSYEIGEILSIAFNKRTSVDYHDFTTVTREEVLQYFEKMQIFITEVSKIIETKLSKQN